MSISQTIRALSVTASLGVLAFLYILYGDLDNTTAKFITFGLLSFTVGFLIYLPTIGASAATQSGAIAKIGTAFGMSLVAFILSVIATSLYVNEHKVISSALNVLVFVIILFAIGTTNINVKHVDAIANHTNYKSDHTQWSSDLKLISENSNDDKVRSLLLRASDDAQYLSRDPSKNKLTINSEISELIIQIRSSAPNVSAEIMSGHINKLKRLFSVRESEIKKARSTC